MPYKKIKQKLLTIDDLTNHCGLFQHDTKLNGGYGCRSKSKNKQELGCCYAFDCPLAFPASIDDLKKYDSYLYEEYKNNVDDECGDWVVQYREIKR